MAKLPQEQDRTKTSFLKFWKSALTSGRNVLNALDINGSEITIGRIIIVI